VQHIQAINYCYNIELTSVLFQVADEIIAELASGVKMLQNLSPYY